MALTIDKLTSPLTSDQVFATFVTELVAFGIPADKWRKGSALSTILRVIAVMFAAFSVVQALANGSGFLDLATGGWLTLHARYVFNVERITETFATGQVTLINGGGGLYTHAAGTYVVKNSTTNKTYTNQEDFTLSPAATLTIDVIATESGSASTSAPGEIDSQGTPDLLVTVSNASAVIGRDAELDEPLRIRCRAKRESVSPLGTRGAYRFAVLSATRLDGTSVDINRVQISPQSSTGVVDIWCASPTGAPTDVDITAVIASVEAIARPDSVTVNVHKATPTALSSSIVVWALSTPGVDAAGIIAAVDAALETMIEDYPIGGRTKPPATQGYLFQSKIEGTAEAAHTAIYAVDGVGGDLPINPGEVATLSTSIVVNFVDEVPQ